MPDICRIAVAPYDARHMYALVDDIATYPDFLPWCERTTVTRNDERVKATLHIRYRGIRTSFTTNNTHNPESQQIIMQLSGDSPLSSLSGNWRFIALADNRCRIEFNLHYEFGNRLLGKFFSGLFSAVFDRFVDQFIEHAKTAIQNDSSNIEVELVSSATADSLPRKLTLPCGATVSDALRHAGIAPAGVPVGIFGVIRPLQTQLSTGDRIEIYEPLKNDPRNARRQRAQQ